MQGSLWTSVSSVRFSGTSSKHFGSADRSSCGADAVRSRENKRERTILNLLQYSNKPADLFYYFCV